VRSMYMLYPSPVLGPAGGPNTKATLVANKSSDPLLPPPRLSLLAHRMPSQHVEFQAVILAGGSGAMLYPLLDERLPKCLLPLCNRPLLYYQLRLLERAGFTEVIIVCEESQRRAFSDLAYDGAIKLDICPTIAGTEGTAEALLQARSKLKTDFFVLAGDLVTEASLHELADTFRTRDATAVVLLKQYEATEDKSLKATPFSREAALADSVTTFVGMSADATDAAHARVVLLRASDRDDGGLAVGRALLEAIPRMTVHTDLTGGWVGGWVAGRQTDRGPGTDCHLYVLKRWVLDLIEQKKLSSLRNDVLPYLVGVQFKRDRESVLGPGLWVGAKSRQTLAHQMTSPLGGQDDDRVRVYGVVLPFNKKTGGSFSARADTTAAYAWMSFALLEHPVGGSTPWEPLLLGGQAPPPAARSPDAGPANASAPAGAAPGAGRELVKTLLGEGCTVHPSATLNRCIVGEGCRIGAHAKLSNCILLRDVEVRDSAVVQNCLVGAGAVLGKACNLNKCQIGTKYVVADGVSLKDGGMLAFAGGSGGPGGGIGGDDGGM
jgi:translation initiation factor eIF-2B subunit gamma